MKFINAMIEYAKKRSEVEGRAVRKLNHFLIWFFGQQQGCVQKFFEGSF